MFREHILKEQFCQINRGGHLIGGDKVSHFGEPIDHHKYHIVPFREGKAFYKVHRDGVSWALQDLEETKRTKGYVIDGLSLLAAGA